MLLGLCHSDPDSDKLLYKIRSAPRDQVNCSMSSTFYIVEFRLAVVPGAVWRASTEINHNPPDLLQNCY